MIHQQIEVGESETEFELRMRMSQHQDHIFWLTPFNHEDIAVGACLVKLDMPITWLRERGYVYPMYHHYWPRHVEPFEAQSHFRCKVCMQRLDAHLGVFKGFKEGIDFTLMLGSKDV